MACCLNTMKSRRTNVNIKTRALTDKFYSRDDNILQLKGLDTKRIEVYEDLISKRLSYDLRKEYEVPLTTNQTYGWLSKYAENYTGLDKELFDNKLPYDPLIVLLYKTVVNRR